MHASLHYYASKVKYVRNISLLIYKADQLPCKAQLQFHHIVYISNYRKPYVHTICKEILQRKQRSPRSFAIWFWSYMNGEQHVDQTIYTQALVYLWNAKFHARQLRSKGEQITFKASWLKVWSRDQLHQMASQPGSLLRRQNHRPHPGPIAVEYLFF